MVKHLKESTKSCMGKFKYDLGIIGLGYVGLPLAVYSVDAGLKVFGFDINSEFEFSFAEFLFKKING